LALAPPACEKLENPSPPAAVRAAGEPAWLVDASSDAGLAFVHTTGFGGEFFFPEIAGSGCGLVDYDGDGDLDLYVLQAFDLSGGLAAPPGAGGNRLYRNDLEPDSQGILRPRFVEVTEAAGVGDRGYGMGVAVGDYDNDGDPDLFVTNFGPDTLYRNEGDGTFRDVTAGTLADAGGDHGWSTSAAFVDYDRDGLLDLFVARYVNFSLRENKVCHSPSGRRDYCGPQSFDPVPDVLYRNRGDGTFSDATVEAGIHRAYGSGLGVVCADFNADGWPDVYVANDGNANQLWMNRADGTFEDTSLFAGAAYNAGGRAEAGMGVSAADFDADGDQDIFLAHLVGEHNTLLVNDGTGLFRDRSEEFGLAASSWPLTGFGTEWSDLDNDGDLDLFVANGGVKIVEELAGEPYPYGNPNKLFVNTGPPRFAYRDASNGPHFELRETSRGSAFGDVDNDGDVDIVVAQSNGPLRLLLNDGAADRAWVELRLVGSESNRSAIGAEVTILRPGLVRRVHADGSYLSANDLRVHVGLGDDEAPQSVRVRWPLGRTEEFGPLEPRRLHVLVEGRGRAP
jgi:hypothetical protein